MSEEIPAFPERLLVAIDGSLSSRNSAQAAVQIAHKQNLDIRGLFVVGARSILEGDNNYKAELNLSDSASPDELMNDFQNQGNDALDWLEEICRLSNVPVQCDLVFGGIPEMILEEARRDHFLALGRRGHVHLNSTDTLGEHFRSIVSRLHAPILIGGAERTNFRCMYLVLTEEEEAKKLLHWAEILQHAFASQVLISMYDDSKTHGNFSDQASDLLKRSNLVDYIILPDPVRSAEEIRMTAAEQHVDLILMEGYRRVALGLWLEKHPIDDVLAASEITALVV
jgi:nucleotide-binding universal stress UspA family protein